jgi:hypothetical protein
MWLTQVFFHWGRTALSVGSALLQFSLLLTWPRHVRIFIALVTHHEDCSLIIFCIVKISFHHLILLGLNLAWWGHHVARCRVVVIFIDSIFLLYIFVKEWKDLSATTNWTKILFLVLVHHQVRLETMCPEVMPRWDVAWVSANDQILRVSF